MTPTRTPKEDLLIGGLDDWAYPGWVAMSVLLAGDLDPAPLRDATLALMAEVMDEGLKVPGDLVDWVHVPWPGTPHQWIERIRSEWISEWGDQIPTPGAIVWLANTAPGDEIAHAVLKREETT